MKKSVAVLGLLLLAVCAFSLSTILQPRTVQWRHGTDNMGILQVLLGDGRRIFANHFFVQADVSFHSGYYPSVFDRALAPKDSRHMTAKEGSTEEEEHERKMAFLGPPRDWIERFGRHFLISEHTHLQDGGEREILPWLKLSAELDPQRVDTYTVASYWLRNRLGKVKEAEEFLREGLRQNPKSYELLFELGRLYSENYHDDDRAAKVWELALRRWNEQQGNKKDPDLTGLEEIVVHLARYEEKAGHFEKAIGYLEVATKASPNPAVLRKQIDDLKTKLR